MATRPFAIALAIVAALTGAASAQAATDASARTGQVRFVKRMDPSFDKYVTNPSTSQKQWLTSHLWRTEVFTPFFDDKTSWYASGWLYSDIYAIYNGSDVARQHPDWILKDASGNPLYIPWGCSNGWCPQYAADITNPAYRAWWIGQLQTNLAKGYKGAWVDDVNMDLRVGNSNGTSTFPYSASLGHTMSEPEWRTAMANFTVQIRASIPADKEIVHNSIWYAAGNAGRDSNPDVAREINSADYINIERGFNDDGLTGGNGEWSQRALQGFIDRVHAKGKGVIIDGFDGSAAGSEYSLANYLLVNSGADAIGEGDQTPDNWWNGWNTDLGTALAARYDWQGLERRDFTGGIALVAEPGAPSRTVQLPQPMVNLAGQTVSSVTISGGHGAVLTGVGVTAGTPDPTGTASTAPAPTNPSSCGCNGGKTTPAKTSTSTGTAAGSTVGTDATACKQVRVTYSTLRWNAKASKFQRRRGSAKVCIDAGLKSGSKAQRAAISKATEKARRASLQLAKAARRESVTAAGSKA
ncbi:MAG: putative glycoside hydrolase [Patulibacter sp.]|nr:putative glycoside hydrolase [Patulibacter sp.]